MEKITPQQIKYNVISLFSGIGGFDLGLIYAGFNLIWANDFDKYAAQSYRVNIGEHLQEGNIREVQHLIPPHDILVGGFPCQPFSSLGKREGFNDKERGTLFFDIIKVLKKHQSKVVLLENVRNILYHDKGESFKRINKELEKLGYTVFYDLLNTKDYGLPQSRGRVFIVAFKKSKFKKLPRFEFPEPMPLKLTLQDLLDEDVDEQYFLTHNSTKRVLTNGIKNYKSKCETDLKIARAIVTRSGATQRASTNNYITDVKNYEKHNAPHKTTLRKLTPNECRKLQGFPSDWNQVVSNPQAYKQYGNAVSVDVAYYLAQKLFLYIEKHKKNNW